MSKINCPFCGQQISMNSKKCNHCGEKLDGNRGIGTATIILIVIVLLIILLTAMPLVLVN